MLSVEMQIKSNIMFTGALVINFDQKFTRFDIDKKNDKAGWFIGSSWLYEGKEYQAANYGNWKSGEQFKYTSWEKGQEIEDVKFRKKMVKEQQAQNQIVLLQKNKENLESAQSAQEQVKKLMPAKTGNWYVRKKGLSGCDNLLSNLNDDLIIPMFDAPKNIVGYQRITQKGKFFLKGQKVESTWFLIGDQIKSNIIYVAEGWSTGQTIYEITGKPCLVTFNCHNIIHAIECFSNSYKGKKYIIAADNDSNKVGIKSARKAAQGKPNIKYILPDFKSSNTARTDFNDLFLSSGYDETKEQLTKIKPEDFVSVELLGFHETRFYFYSNRSKTVYDFSYSGMKEGQLAEIASEQYWLSNYYQKYTKDGEPIDHCDWLKTAQKIAETQHQIGRFSQNNIKGFGSWNDSGKTVINTGQCIYVDGQKRSFSDRHDLKYFYYPARQIDLDFEKNTDVKFDKIIDALELVDFKDNTARMYFLGFLVHACAFSSLRWRTHVWLSAPFGTGKSTVLEFIQKILINSKLTQDSSSAGIRQMAKHDATVVLADEAEGEVKRSRQLVELAKQASSGGDSVIIRGSNNMSGSVEYNPSLLFCFASIRKAQMTEAESSRIIDISLKKVNRFDAKKNDKRLDLLDDAALLGPDLYIYVNQNLDKISELRKEIKNLLSEKGFSGRASDTHSNLLSGFAFITGFDATETVKQLVSKNIIEDEIQNSNYGDKESFVDAMLQLIIRDESKERTLEEIIISKRQDLLSIYGITVRQEALTDKIDVFFTLKNRNLVRLFEKQTEFKNPYAQMKQDSDRFLSRVAKISGKTKRVIEYGYIL